jgi:hypothetical protein
METGRNEESERVSIPDGPDAVEAWAPLVILLTPPEIYELFATSNGQVVKVSNQI